MEKTKSALRKEFLEKRNSLSKEEIQSKSFEVAGKLFSLDEFKNSKAIFSYISFGSEVNTHEIIREALKIGKKIAVPGIDFKYEKMFPSLIKDFDKDLEKNRIGFFEPKKDAINPLNPEEIDLILVPGVVFDLHGHRIGSGKAYYDRYLSSFKNHAAIIGLAYDFQIIDKIAKEEHDKKMNKIISEKRVIDCSR